MKITQTGDDYTIQSTDMTTLIVAKCRRVASQNNMYALSFCGNRAESHDLRELAEGLKKVANLIDGTIDLPADPRTKAPPMTPQCRAILRHVRSKGSITQVEASAVHGIRALPRRISDLQANGYAFNHVSKTDPAGQRYVRYYSTDASVFRPAHA